ncbi:MAG: ribose ABC transporter permease [Gemmatales bacterium]|nr:MAG: ribose ABC transporter permease [Gemmatales bacterium]
MSEVGSGAISKRFRLPALSGPVLGLVLVVSLFVVLISAKGGTREALRFVGPRNWQSIVHEATVFGVLALGMLMVIISGGIDLSVGSVVGLVMVVTMQIYRSSFEASGSMVQATLLAVPAGILVGGLCGFVNGLVITQLNVAPFVATLGMMGIARGLAFAITRTSIAYPAGGWPPWFSEFAIVHSDYFFNPGFWILLLLALGVYVLLHYTALGRYCYAIGSNESAARLCGVPIEKCKLKIYTLAGILTGWAGVLMFMRLQSGEPQGGREMELLVIAAVVVGGASLSGGQGTVIGTLIGVLILEILKNGVDNFEVPVEMRYILIGLIIIGNTALSQWQQPQQK